MCPSARCKHTPESSEKEGQLFIVLLLLFKLLHNQFCSYQLGKKDVHQSFHKLHVLPITLTEREGKD